MEAGVPNPDLTHFYRCYIAAIKARDFEFVAALIHDERLHERGASQG